MTSKATGECFIYSYRGFRICCERNPKPLGEGWRPTLRPEWRWEATGFVCNLVGEPIGQACWDWALTQELAKKEAELWVDRCQIGWDIFINNREAS